jgi:hypothetical protein
VEPQQGEPMADRDRDAAPGDSACSAPEGEPPDSAARPPRENDASATHQAIVTQERALASGEENVV